jgi:hypothetical protein
MLPSLVSDDLNGSVWSTIPSDVLSQSRLEPNKLQITTRMVNGNSLHMSISLQLSINSYLYGQPLCGIGDNKVSRIIWRSMRPRSPSDPWNTVVCISTLPYGWIPEDGVDIFGHFLVQIKSQWLELCHRFDNHLAKRASLSYPHTDAYYFGKKLTKGLVASRPGGIQGEKP